MIDYDVLRKLFLQGGTSLETLSDLIYLHYSNSEALPFSTDYSNIKGGYYKDQGWFYDKRLDQYFKSIGKYLLKKGSDAVVAGHEEFSIDPWQESIGQKNLVNILIPKKIETAHWIWLHGKHYHSFSYQARLYFSLSGGRDSIQFIQDLAKVLNDKEIPFRLKYEKKFTKRNENCVLYFDKSHYFLVFLIVKNYYSKYGIFQQPQCFPFVKTFPEFPGVAFAEDPDSGQSFGQQRCQVLAEILINNGGNIAVIDQELKERGFNPEKFYLNPYTNFPYNFSVFDQRIDFHDYIVNLPSGKGYIRLSMVKKIVYLILKNFIVYQDGENFLFHIPECKNKPGEIALVNDKTTYKLCSDDEKEEIIYLLLNYLEALRKKNLADHYVLEFVKYYLRSFQTKSAIEKFEDRLNTLETHCGGEVNQAIHIQFLGEEQTQPIYEVYQKNLIQNFRHRGVVSYLPNDEFIASYHNFGYVYIGTHFLRQIISI